MDYRTCAPAIIEFEPNPHNPIFTPSSDPQAWDSSGLLTPQVFVMNGAYYMIYAGLRNGLEPRIRVQSGLAMAHLIQPNRLRLDSSV